MWKADLCIGAGKVLLVITNICLAAANTCTIWAMNLAATAIDEIEKEQ